MGIPVAGIPRFPGAGSSARGQPAPKARPNGVADGQRANIPAPARMVEAAGKGRQARRGLRMAAWRRASAVRKGSLGTPHPEWPAPEKSPPPTEAPTVPKPTQVGGCADAPRRARETSSRNSATQPRNFGRRGPPRGGAENRPMQLFNKNTALRERESGHMECDT